ncbi:MAG TPA: carboxymuconolactone decarboxylase family protein [Bryobacteraceae bacterium]|nr:carboxymuconolactone decarboxylase family protein [Bryobacteraceae bacterium]
MRPFLLAFSLVSALLAQNIPSSPVSNPKSVSNQKWKPPRTAERHPVLDGIWNSASLTPLQRPSNLGTKEFYTEAEAAVYEQQRLAALNRDRRDGPADVDVGRSYNELFYDRGTHLAPNRRTSLIVDPPDGRIPPMTAAAQARLKAAEAHFAAHPADGPEDRPLPDRCLMFSQSGPPMIPGNYNNNYQIVQTRDHVAILAEMGNQVRIIPLDGRPHPPAQVQAWMGDSRGHWEGDTLVVETSNFRFNERSRFGVQYDNGLTDQNLRVTERFTRTGPDAITYRATVEDPTVYTRPWTFEVILQRADGPLFEYACHEGNYGLADVLQGARAEEKTAAPKDVSPQSGFRLPLPQREELDENGKKLYDAARRTDGRSVAGLRGPEGIRLYSPKAGELQRALNEYLRFDSGLSAPVRELAILVAAREMDNQFEWAAHEPLARKAGVSETAIDVVKNRKTTAGVADEQAVIIQLGREAFQHTTVSAETFARALKIFGSKDLVNIVSLMGSYASTAVLLRTFDMQLPAGVRPPLP